MDQRPFTDVELEIIEKYPKILKLSKSYLKIILDQYIIYCFSDKYLSEVIDGTHTIHRHIENYSVIVGMNGHIFRIMKYYEWMENNCFVRDDNKPSHILTGDDGSITLKWHKNGTRCATREIEILHDGNIKFKFSSYDEFNRLDSCLSFNTLANESVFYRGSHSDLPPRTIKDFIENHLPPPINAGAEAEIENVLVLPTIII